MLQLTCFSKIAQKMPKNVSFMMKMQQSSTCAVELHKINIKSIKTNEEQWNLSRRNVFEWNNVFVIKKPLEWKIKIDEI